jgi:hypothetical protein
MTALYIDLVSRKIEFHIPNWITGVLTVVLLGFLLTGFELKFNNRNVDPSAAGMRRIFSLVNTNSVYANAYLDILSGRAARYARQNEERSSRLLCAAGGDTVEFPLYSYVPETIFIQDANHPFGMPDALSRAIAGEVRTLRYVETGTPAPRKDRF